MTVMAQAGNSVKRVGKVTKSVTLSKDVDLVISGAEPFGAKGSVNIKNTEHGVLILQEVKPSLVLKNWLAGHVFVSGKQAQDGVNCQVKMYARGTIIMPYAAGIRPLTVYAKRNFKGESLDSFGLENSGGYMNSLSDERMNNRIRSFRLKRGYMVTFSTGLSGWGYSRCFIADTEDLEMAELPDVLDGRISSYRLFRWLDAGKKSLASDTNPGHNALLGSTSCYGWGVSKDMLPDLDCVANHIYEDYPSSAAIGMATATCHTKNNNEPGNRSDDTPQDVTTVLANWQNMMRTGLRLGSETSHDGSWSHLRAFIDSIDARGWRCDFLDLHCYWNSGFSESSMQKYYNSFGKRPIWISEWVWGASWNNNGIFATDRTFSIANQQKNFNHLKEILPALENSPYVERYYYWNGEAACSRLLYRDTLSLGGEYYAQLESGIAYRKQYEKVPNVVYREPHSLMGELKDRTAGTVRLSWSELNGDMIDEIRVQRKRKADTDFVTIATIEPKDQNAAALSLSFTDTVTVPGVYVYRIADLTAAGTEVYSGSTTINAE